MRKKGGVEIAYCIEQRQHSLLSHHHQSQLIRPLRLRPNLQARSNLPLSLERATKHAVLMQDRPYQKLTGFPPCPRC